MDHQDIFDTFSAEAERLTVAADAYREGMVATRLVRLGGQQDTSTWNRCAKVRPSVIRSRTRGT